MKKEVELLTKLEDIVILSESVISLAKEIHLLYFKIKEELYNEKCENR